jgi:hypothetical protein
MAITRRGFDKHELGLAVVLLCHGCLWPQGIPGQSLDGSALDAGVICHADGAECKSLEKQTGVQSGRPTYSARIKGSHSGVRLTAGQPLKFRVCGVDPTRFKLYTFRSSKDERAVAIAKIGNWTGSARSVLSQSEVPVTIQKEGSNCFEITPRDVLKSGEYGFSPVDSNDVFAFGIGDIQRVK